jgi:cellulose synthase/poly-beta-1,6-N-acetylglucosamine synthase-like glycosyltransferase
MISYSLPPAIILTVIKVLYTIPIVLLSVWGFNSLWLSALYLKNGRVNKKKTQTATPLYLPRVTIQLPMFNERYMVRRLLKAVVAINYPPDRLQIQVLDDSTDDTSSLAQGLVAHYQAVGINIEYIHRKQRGGYKAGALAEGLKTATGDLVAVFDADFIPPSDWLMKVVGPFIEDPRLGCLQTRWGHLNSQTNLLTRLQTMALDGHFIVEQGARSSSGLLMGFNGTCGIWRRDAIDDAGGWSADTLTEDLDLSFRSQLCGWKIAYLPEIVVPGELVPSMDGFQRQQARWAQGYIQSMRKLWGRVHKSNKSLYVKVGAYVQLTGYLAFPSMLLTFLLTLPVGLWEPKVMSLFPWTAIAGLGPMTMYLISKTQHIPRWQDRLLLLPGLLMMSISLSVSNTVAVFKGLFKNGGVFERTPKMNLSTVRAKPVHAGYTLPGNPLVWVELLLAAYALLSMILLIPRLGMGMFPWLAMYFAGYVYAAIDSLKEEHSPHVRRAKANQSMASAD